MRSSVLMKHGSIEASVSLNGVKLLEPSSVLMKHGSIEALTYESQ